MLFQRPNGEVAAKLAETVATSQWQPSARTLALSPAVVTRCLMVAFSCDLILTLWWPHHDPEVTTHYFAVTLPFLAVILWWTCPDLVVALLWPSDNPLVTFRMTLLAPSDDPVWWWPLFWPEAHALGPVLTVLSFGPGPLPHRGKTPGLQACATRLHQGAPVRVAWSLRPGFPAWAPGIRPQFFLGPRSSVNSKQFWFAHHSCYRGGCFWPPHP